MVLDTDPGVDERQTVAALPAEHVLARAVLGVGHRQQLPLDLLQAIGQQRAVGVVEGAVARADDRFAGLLDQIHRIPDGRLDHGHRVAAGRQRAQQTFAAGLVGQCAFGTCRAGRVVAGTVDALAADHALLGAPQILLAAHQGIQAVLLADGGGYSGHVGLSGGTQFMTDSIVSNNFCAVTSTLAAAW